MFFLDLCHPALYNPTSPALQQSSRVSLSKAQRASLAEGTDGFHCFLGTYLLTNLKAYLQEQHSITE